MPVAVAAVFGMQCVSPLSDDCARTLTCGNEPHATLDSQCRWRYPDGGIWEGGPHRTPEGIWVWPDGKEAETQDFVCPIGDAGVDAGGELGADCSTAPCDAPQVCNPANHRCVDCLQKSDCASATSMDFGPLLVCDVADHRCVACQDDNDCKDNPSGLHCSLNLADPTKNHCVECLRSTNCSNGTVCDVASNQCTTRCTGVNQCTGDKPVCNLPSGATTGVCVQCLSNESCPTGMQCNLASKQCVQCVDSTACGMGQVCNTLNRCVQCVNDTQCSKSVDTPYCDLDSYTCVACLDSAQCKSPDQSRCNTTTHTCTTCTADVQCEAAAPYCNAQGHCVVCKTNDDCNATADTPVCDTASGACVACNNNNDCVYDPHAGRCDTSIHSCAGCNSNDQCGGKFGVKSLCLTASGACTECINGADCASDATKSRCDTTSGLCAACQVNQDCSAISGKPACTGGANAHCVECATSTDCAQNAHGAVCKTTTDGSPAPVNSCVQCLTSSDCKDPGAAKCVLQQCQPCTADADCADAVSGSTPLGVCDTSSAPAKCVQCTAAKRTVCGNNVCDATTKLCSDQQVGSADRCGGCVSDDQCSNGDKCAQETFQSTIIGNFCFPPSASGVCSARGFTTATNTTTVDGTATDLCMPVLTTCPAIQQRASGKACAADTDCGVANLNDGACDLTRGGACTTPCGAATDCVGNGTCSVATSICQ
jgi:hypothetical protein